MRTYQITLDDTGMLHSITVDGTPVRRYPPLTNTRVVLDLLNLPRDGGPLVDELPPEELSMWEIIKQHRIDRGRPFRSVFNLDRLVNQNTLEEEGPAL